MPDIPFNADVCVRHVAVVGGNDKGKDGCANLFPSSQCAFQLQKLPWSRTFHNADVVDDADADADAASTAHTTTMATTTMATAPVPVLPTRVPAYVRLVDTSTSATMWFYGRFVFAALLALLASVIYEFDLRTHAKARLTFLDARIAAGGTGERGGGSARAAWLQSEAEYSFRCCCCKAPCPLQLCENPYGDYDARDASVRSAPCDAISCVCVFFVAHTNLTLLLVQCDTADAGRERA
jgi:hypothetical protein